MERVQDFEFRWVFILVFAGAFATGFSACFPFSQAPTVISGRVLEPPVSGAATGKPLANVTVSFANSAIAPVKTDKDGIFELAHVFSGEQTLIIDGTTVASEPATTHQKKFSKLYITVDIDSSKSQFIRDPIYLSKNNPPVGIPAPSQEIAIEPSGVSFSQPVKLILPK